MWCEKYCKLKNPYNNILIYFILKRCKKNNNNFMNFNLEVIDQHSYTEKKFTQQYTCKMHKKLNYFNIL